jgi:hypothetical protein
MNRPTPLSTATLPAPKSISRSPLRRGFPLIAVALACIGLSPMAQAVSPPPDGGYGPGGNTAEGTNALFSNTTGVWNTALGYQALYQVTTGNQNTATGFQALFSNTTGDLSVANGAQALYSNTTGFWNTATGFQALYSNTTGSDNTANGLYALVFNTTGGSNTANGVFALNNNTTGGSNTATGFDALSFSATGNNNTAIGAYALSKFFAGDSNTAIGFGALSASGFRSGSGSGNIALGYYAGAGLMSGDNNIYIGNPGPNMFFDESNTIRIGTQGTQTATFIAAIRGVGTYMDAVPVVIDSFGQLGTASSSRRFKKEIKPMDQTSEAILGLQPVTFQYKSDTRGTPQFGLIAEEVAEVNPDLVVRDAAGEIYSVRYEAVNAMLLNEFLKEHRTVQELKSTVAKQEAIIAQQQNGMEALAATLKAQASQIQKVSAQLELSKATPQMAGNDR